MEKGLPPSLFVNDGSFMERFKQLQKEKENETRENDKEKGAASVEPKPVPIVSSSKSTVGKTGVELKANVTSKSAQPKSGGKLAFSLKQKSKIVKAVKLDADEDEESDSESLSDDAPTKRQKLGESDATEKPTKLIDVAPPTPSDPTVKNVADKLASFVAKNGRQFEHINRQKNPGDTPFKFLFDKACADYKYYEYRLAIEEKALPQSKDSQKYYSDGASASARKSTTGLQRATQRQSSYQTPASALYESMEETAAGSRPGETAPPTGADPVAMVEYYMKKAAEEEKKKPPKQSNDEMPPTASLQVPEKRGHHMGDYIPPEELKKFLAACNDAAAQKAAREAAEKARIQADNVGHKLLSKMGWKEGQGLGSSKSGISDPIMAGSVKQDNLGVGAFKPGEVTPNDDIYEQYKKRMMLGYRYRPNPLNNPRKAYY